MPLDWLNTPLDKQSVSDLIARKKRERAIEALREQFQKQIPSVAQRLQLADLLVMAGRDVEAVPILMGLAEEFSGDGFVAKAVAILKRVERIAPGRDEVRAKLKGLVQKQLSFAPTVTAAIPADFAFGMEEIGDDGEMPLDAPVATPEFAAAELEVEEPEALEAEPTREAAVLDAEPATDIVAEANVESLEIEADVAGEAAAVADLVAAEPEGEPEVEAEPEPEIEAEIEPEVEPEPLEADSQGDADDASDEARPDEPAAIAAADPPQERIRSVFRRFLSSLPGAEKEEEEPETPVADEETDAAETVEVEPRADDPALAIIEPAEVLPSVGAASAPESLEEEFPLDASPAAPAPDAAGPEPAAATPTSGVGARLRGAFRRFFSAADEPDPGAAPLDLEAPATAAPEELAADPLGNLVAVPDEASAGEDDLLAELASPALAQAAATDGAFQADVLDLIEDVLQRGTDAAATPRPPAAGAAEEDEGARLVASPLFHGLGEEELMAVLMGLELQTFEPGDIIVAEGAPGDSLFILTTGSVRVFVRSPAGRSMEVARLKEGNFFGELSCLSGRPRNATVTAVSECEMLELGRATLDDIAQKHPRVRAKIEEVYLSRASSPETAAVRAFGVADEATQQKAIEVLEAHFGQSRWDPRMRLRLATVLSKAGKDDDAIPILIGLADDLSREGYHDKAIAILKKVERLQSRHLEQVNLAPLKKAAAPPPPSRPAPTLPVPQAKAGPAPSGRPKTDTAFQGWLIDVVRDSVKKKRPSELPAVDTQVLSTYGRGLKASPLFEGFAEDELLALIRGMRLLTFEPGEIIVTEGEPGESLFVLTAGEVNVSIRDPTGRDVRLCTLEEGQFFGEISTLSGRPRTATITAAARCELLELDRPNLNRVIDMHPRVKNVLEEVYLMRAASPETARIRGHESPHPG